MEELLGLPQSDFNVPEAHQLSQQIFKLKKH